MKKSINLLIKLSSFFVLSAVFFLILGTDTSKAYQEDTVEKDRYSTCYISKIDTDALAVIEAYITLDGSGTGCHAKLVANAPISAVSWGIQYDVGASKGYGGRTMLLLENITSNAHGQQAYSRPSNVEVNRGEPCHLMMSVYPSGSGRLYYNGVEAGLFSNPGLVASYFQLACEGCARLEGDSVNAKFQNVRMRVARPYSPGVTYGKTYYQKNPTLGISSGGGWGNFTISGKVTGIGGADWDSAYGSVSYCVVFANNPG